MDQRHLEKEIDGPPPRDLPAGEKAVATSLEIASRAASVGTLDEIYFLLTNDLRLIAGFDRCFLITHFRGSSDVVSATHQPVLDKKSKLQEHLAFLANHVRKLDSPLVTDKVKGITSTHTVPLSADFESSLSAYLEQSGCGTLCIIPLTYDRAEIGHLLMEFHGENVPSKTGLMAVMKIAPAFGAALFSRWILTNKPRLSRRLKPETGRSFLGGRKLYKRLPVVIFGLLVLATAFLLIPFSSTVGGEAEIAPQEKQYAFCKISGLIDKVNVQRGSEVTKGQVIATLDRTEIDYKIRSEERQREILGQEIRLLKSRAIDDPAQLARSGLLELKRKRVWEELHYLRWQKNFLEIKAPVAGIILTKEVETLEGKRFEAGEPFCEIAEPGMLKANVYVPEARIMSVKVGQETYLYLNNAPSKAYRLKVGKISPSADAQPRFGNVYEVSAPFKDLPAGVKVGMKGIGKIHTGEATLWELFSRRLVVRWNQLSLYFP
jgi:Barrel-sandwich domain of CusB or HlyD membrane-fusion